jgi:hypothetical protein
LVAVGAGEGTAPVAEQVAFEELAGDGGAVNGDERFLGAIGEGVDGTGEDFLAGAAFARNRTVAVLSVFESICRQICRWDRATGSVERRELETAHENGNS